MRISFSIFSNPDVMNDFSIPIQIRWADIDANRHLRHSVYYDYGAMARIMILSDRGLTTARLEELQVGPVLFREEGIFRREVLLEDTIRVNVRLIKATPDFSRWSMRHQVIKADETVAATIEVDGAWIDLTRRKLAVPDASLQKIMESFPRPDDFQFVYPEKK
jgi:acyl-CoA thioester hydrolase